MSTMGSGREAPGRAAGQQLAWKGQCRERLLGDMGTVCPERV